MYFMDLKNDTIAQIVSEDFRAAVVFKKHAIDFCCKGGMTIKEVCDKKTISERSLLKELESVLSTQEDIEISELSVDTVYQYILCSYHMYVKEKAPILSQFLDMISKLYGQSDPHLHTIKDLFNQSFRIIERNLQNEENVIFPHIQNLIDAQRANSDKPVSTFEALDAPISVINGNNTRLMQLLEQIKQLSNDFTVSDYACNTYVISFSMLSEFYHKTQQYVSLERDVLFPKAVEIEKSF